MIQVQIRVSFRPDPDLEYLLHSVQSCQVESGCSGHCQNVLYLLNVM